MIKRLQVLDVVFFAIPFTAGILYLLSFYPGILSYDSIFQWDQAARFSFNNWHPAYHTILVWVLSRMVYSPAIVALFQITLFSGVLAYGLRTFRDFGVPAALLILLDALISVSPINGMMEITLWKDVLFGIFVLLLTIYLLKIIASKGAWFASGWNWVFFGLVMANVSLLRHNGFPVAFGALLAVLLVFRWRKQALLALGTAILYIGQISGPLYALFQVDRTNTQPLGVLLIHPIAAHVRLSPALSADEAAYLNRIYPLENGWPYSCYDATIFFYQGTSFLPVKEDPAFAAKLLGRLTMESPLVTIKHFACLSSFVWHPYQPAGVLLETVYTENQDLYPYPDWQGYAAAIDQRSKLPALRWMLVSGMENVSRIDPGKIAWRPAVYLYLLCASSLYFAYRAKNPAILLLLVPAVLQTLVIAVSTQLQSLRYQYPVYLIAMLFTIPMLYLAIRLPGSWMQAEPSWDSENK